MSYYHPRNGGHDRRTHPHSRAPREYVRPDAYYPPPQGPDNYRPAPSPPIDDRYGPPRRRDRSPSPAEFGRVFYGRHDAPAYTSRDPGREWSHPGADYPTGVRMQEGGVGQWDYFRTPQPREPDVPPPSRWQAGDRDRNSIYNRPREFPSYDGRYDDRSRGYGMYALVHLSLCTAQPGCFIKEAHTIARRPRHRMLDENRHHDAMPQPNTEEAPGGDHDDLAHPQDQNAAAVRLYVALRVAALDPAPVPLYRHHRDRRSRPPQEIIRECNHPRQRTQMITGTLLNPGRPLPSAWMSIHHNHNMDGLRAGLLRLHLPRHPLSQQNSKCPRPAQPRNSSLSNQISSMVESPGHGFLGLEQLKRNNSSSSYRRTLT